MFCPKCKAEYREGITVCTECSIPLVEVLPVEIDTSSAEEKIKLLNDMDSRENLHALSNGNQAYVEKSAKYEDMKSTAYSFLIVGFAGVLLLLLTFAGIIPLQFAPHMKIIMGIVMGILFLSFLIVGFRSNFKLSGLKAQAQKEQEDMNSAKEWLFAQAQAQSIDAENNIHESDDLQQKYFLRSNYIKRMLKQQFPDYEDDFLDYLTEEFYEEMFPQD